MMITHVRSYDFLTEINELTDNDMTQLALTFHELINFFHLINMTIQNTTSSYASVQTSRTILNIVKRDTS